MGTVGSEACSLVKFKLMLVGGYTSPRDPLPDLNGISKLGKENFQGSTVLEPSSSLYDPERKTILIDWSTYNPRTTSLPHKAF